MGMSLKDSVTTAMAAYAALLSSWNFYVTRRKKNQAAESKKDEFSLQVVQPGRFKATAGPGDRSGDALLLIHLQAEVMNRRPSETTLTIKSVRLAGVEIVEERSSMWLGVPRRPVMDRNVTIGAGGTHPFTITLTLLVRQPVSVVADQINGAIVFQDTFAGELSPIEFAANKNRA